MIKDSPKKIKIADDTLLYDTNIENVFYHRWDYLLQQAHTGIIINEKKFKFCWDNRICWNQIINTPGFDLSGCDVIHNKVLNCHD